MPGKCTVVQQVLAPGVTLLRVSLLLRYRTFFRSLLTSPSPEVQDTALLAPQDLRTSVGANLTVIREESGLNPWTCPLGGLKAALLWAEEVPIPAADIWRVPYMKRLFVKQLHHYYSRDYKEVQRVNDPLDSLVTA